MPWVTLFCLPPCSFAPSPLNICVYLYCFLFHRPVRRGLLLMASTLSGHTALKTLLGPQTLTCLMHIPPMRSANKSSSPTWWFAGSHLSGRFPPRKYPRARYVSSQVRLLRACLFLLYITYSHVLHRHPLPPWYVSPLLSHLPYLQYKLRLCYPLGCIYLHPQLTSPPLTDSRKQP